MRRFIQKIVPIDFFGCTLTGLSLVWAIRWPRFCKNIECPIRNRHFWRKCQRVLCKIIISESRPVQHSKSHNSAQTVAFFECSKVLRRPAFLSLQKMRQSGQNYDFWNVGSVNFQKWWFCIWLSHFFLLKLTILHRALHFFNNNA